MLNGAAVRVRSGALLVMGALLVCRMTLDAQVRPEPLRRLASGPRIELREVLRIGSLDGPDDAFGRIMSVALDRSGRILVADDQNHRLAVYDPRGRLLRFVGRQGNGPGEFQAPWHVAVDPQDSVFVWDANQARISIFTPELDFARSFRIPPQWVVNGIEFLPGQRLLISAYGRGEPGALHITDRAGQVLQTFGPSFRGLDLSGFEASLLGGQIDLQGNSVVYSNKSPYELSFYDLKGRLRRHCVGQPGWTTPPADVVRRRSTSRELLWNRYVHTSRMLALGNDLYLNIIFDPVADRRVLDLVRSDCSLLRRTVLDMPLNIETRLGSRIVAVRNISHPEVVVYEMRILN